MSPTTASNLGRALEFTPDQLAQNIEGTLAPEQYPPLFFPFMWLVLVALGCYVGLRLAKWLQEHPARRRVPVAVIAVALITAGSGERRLELLARVGDSHRAFYECESRTLLSLEALP